MLIYARLLLIVILLTAVLNMARSAIVMSRGGVAVGAFMLLWSGFFAWLAWTNWGEASDCVNVMNGPANF